MHNKVLLYNNITSKKNCAVLNFCFNTNNSVQVNNNMYVKYVSFGFQILNEPSASYLQFAVCSPFEQKSFFINNFGMLQTAQQVLFPFNANYSLSYQLQLLKNIVSNQLQLQFAYFSRNDFYKAEVLNNQLQLAIIGDHDLQLLLPLNFKKTSTITNAINLIVQLFTTFIGYVYATPLLTYIDNYYFTDSSSKLSVVMAHSSSLSNRLCSL